MAPDPLAHSKERAAIGARIQLHRKSLGWTPDELARHAGRSRSYISKLENGKADPTLTTLLLVADALGVNLRNLIPTGRRMLEDDGFFASVKEAREALQRTAAAEIATARLETKAALRAADRARRRAP